MKIYTKTGDEGVTSLFSGQRVPKDSQRVEAYGSVDELDSVLGLARAFCRHADVVANVYDIQKLLWRVMAEVASCGEQKSSLTNLDVEAVEQTIDKFAAKLPPLNHFIIPGGCRGSAFLDLARTTARRAERQLWRLHRQEPINEQVLILINRLSDLCFTLSRVENESEG